MKVTSSSVQLSCVKKLKKTKQIQFGRFWKRSKYVKKNYEEDLTNLIDFYKEKGYRDARVVSDSLIKEKDGNVSLNIAVEEGKRYYFGDIRFWGTQFTTTAYSIKF